MIHGGAAAVGKGYANAEERVKVVMTLLERATRLAAAGCEDVELEALADHAVLLSRPGSSLNSYIKTDIPHG